MRVAATAIEAAIFSVTMRFASVCALVPPAASFIIRSPITCCASIDSIAVSNQNLNITDSPLQNEAAAQDTRTAATVTRYVGSRSQTAQQHQDKDETERHSKQPQKDRHR